MIVFFFRCGQCLKMSVILCLKMSVILSSTYDHMECIGYGFKSWLFCKKFNYFRAYFLKRVQCFDPPAMRFHDILSDDSSFGWIIWL